jgi:hypothetical protein
MGSVIEEDRNFAGCAEMQYRGWLALWRYQKDGMPQSYQPQPREEKFGRAVAQ